MDKQAELALHQFIGYGHAKKGYDIINLVESLALTQSEWPEIKTEIKVWLSESEIAEIEAYLVKLPV